MQRPLFNIRHSFHGYDKMSSTMYRSCVEVHRDSRFGSLWVDLKSGEGVVEEGWETEENEKPSEGVDDGTGDVVDQPVDEVEEPFSITLLNENHIKFKFF